MNTWTPIFSKIVDSSIWLEPDHVRIVWITLLAKKDADQIVRATAFMIASWSKKTEAEVLDALKILSSPDTRRLEPQPFEGRRIKRVEEGWEVLNGRQYEDLMRSINRREYKRNKQAEYRANPKRKRRPPMAGAGLARAAAEAGQDVGQVADRVNDEMAANRAERGADI